MGREEGQKSSLLLHISQKIKKIYWRGINHPTLRIATLCPPPLVSAGNQFCRQPRQTTLPAATAGLNERIMAMSRALRPVVLVLALGLASATPAIPSEFFEAQRQQQQHADLGAEMEANFRAHMAEYGLTFSTKGEYRRRLRIYAANRCKGAGTNREKGRNREREGEMCFEISRVVRNSRKG